MVIVVGSGAGGATVAKELAAKDVAVTLIEKGPAIGETELEELVKKIKAKALKEEAKKRGIKQSGIIGFSRKMEKFIRNELMRKRKEVDKK